LYLNEIIAEDKLNFNGPIVNCKSDGEIGAYFENGSFLNLTAGRFASKGQVAAICFGNDYKPVFNKDIIESGGATNYDYQIRPLLTSFSSTQEGKTVYTYAYGDDCSICMSTEIVKGYKVDFTGESTSAGSVYVKPGAKAENPDSVQALYTNWYSDAERNNVYSFETIINSDTVIYGKEKEYSDVYLLKKNNDTAYDLYADADGKFLYTASKGTAWDVVESNVGADYYAGLNVTGKLGKNINFVQYAAKTHIPVIQVIGSNGEIGGFNAGENTLSFQPNGEDSAISVKGNIKANNIYIGALDVTVENGSISEVGSSASNLLSIGPNANVIIMNGGIDFKNGTVTVNNNSEVVIKKNSLNNASEVGIKAHTINVSNSTLTIKDVNTGILLYDPTAHDADGAVLALDNKAGVLVKAKEIGILGTSGPGGYFYNNVTVSDTESSFEVTGGTKAVESVAVTPIPDSKVLKGSEGKSVEFKVNSDNNCTTDYYYTGTKTPSTSLTLVLKKTDTYQVVNTCTR